MTGWREDNRDSRLRSLHLRGVASRDNSISGIVHTQRKWCWEKVESTLRVRRKEWYYLSLTPPKIIPCKDVSLGMKAVTMQLHSHGVHLQAGTTARHC